MLNQLFLANYKEKHPISMQIMQIALIQEYTRYRAPHFIQHNESI